jgi:hypothetical protein
MKKIILYFAYLCIFTSVHAQIPPQELIFDGKLEAIQQYILPLKFVGVNGYLNNIVQYELTFAQELNPAQKLKIRVTYDVGFKPAIMTYYPNGAVDGWSMRIGKTYQFKLTKFCTNLQDAGGKTIYNYICIPQTPDCSKIVFKNDNVAVVYPHDYQGLWGDIVIHEGHLYKFKMLHTNKNSFQMERGGFKD